MNIHVGGAAFQLCFTTPTFLECTKICLMTFLFTFGLTSNVWTVDKSMPENFANFVAIRLL